MTGAISTFSRGDISLDAIAFAASFIIALGLTPLVRRLALRYKIMAQPREIKSHALDNRTIPYLGGLAIFASFSVVTLVVMPMSRELAALLVGGLILASLGAADDVLGAVGRTKGLRPGTRLIWQFIAAAVVLAGGIGIVSITNPLGGVISLVAGRTAIHIGSLRFHITPIANALSILWIMGMVNTINFLDGIDGLACGVSAIAALVIFLLALHVGQPLVALLAIILAGSALGFLPFNFFPAKIFMGDAGAYFLGLSLALLAIYSGGKLATVGLVLGFTIIDAIWATVRRLRRGVHPFTSDREHLHHLLLQAGLSQRRAVLFLYLLAIIFGAVALESHSFSKLIASIVLLALMVVLIASLIRIGQRKA
jgi:UDP-GlcNAc:undecaprenyl-phosphate/decaprenyl-phosphate GlcNAc-1-phosphate transferase